jgi:glucosamine 6-phosphate synthetase-like amidotransferase/phosphosugar isomerase protein
MLYPSLSHIVLSTIKLFRELSYQEKLDFSGFHTPLMVGSGNGYYTGRILFRNLGAYFATESEVEKKLENIPSITDVVVVSASGEKHAPIILEAAKKYGKKTFLISSNEKSSGRDMADASIIMPKIREPYTYNTSTYFGYMLTEYPESDLSA